MGDRVGGAPAPGQLMWEKSGCSENLRLEASSLDKGTNVMGQEQELHLGYVQGEQHQIHVCVARGEGTER